MNRISKSNRREQGFTLVEIIVVLVILAILAAFTIPTMLGFVEDAKGKAYIAEAREVYVAAQAVTTEYSGITNLMDGNNPQIGDGSVNGNAHSNGIAVSISSFEVQYRHRNYPTPDKYLKGHEPQMKASNQMYQYLSADLPVPNQKDVPVPTNKDQDTTSISKINLLKNPTHKPWGHRAAWIVTVGLDTDANDGEGDNGKSRTGKVTKVVYLRDGYQVTIVGNNATIERYKIPTNADWEVDSFGI